MRLTRQAGTVPVVILLVQMVPAPSARLSL